MNWFTELFTQQTFTQAVMVLSLICASGLALGNIKIFGISLGVAFVFFAGIIAGHFGIEIDPEMLAFGQNFGLILYIYALGLQVGPGFFSSFKQGGIKLNVISLLVLIVGSALAVAIHFVAKVSLPDSVGLLAGAVTNTPMLGAAQQTLLQMNPEGVQEANSMAMACAVAYPFGIIGMILSVMIMRALFAPKKASNKEDRSADNTFVTEYQISNP
ncbi:MAG: transporter, partial [Bacteroidales bacterium]|nr:transporter [Bacteroidales bacterium]